MSLLEILEEKGTQLRKPYTEHLDDGIFELRCKLASNISRALFFFYIDGKIITNGFIKKTQKTPPAEIELAKKRRADYLRRERKHHEKS